MFKLEVSWRGLFVLAAAIGAVWVIPQVWAVVLLIAVACIFMAALLPYVEWLVRHRFPRVLAVLAVILAVLAILGGLAAMFVPAMVSEFTDLRDNLPNDAQRLEDFLDDFGIDVELSDRAEEINWSEVVSGRVAVDYGQKVLFGLLSAITIIVLTAYLLVDAPKMKAYLYRFIPDHREREADELLEAMGRVVGGYIRGQVITSAIIALYTLAVLLILGVDNPLAFAVLAGFADIIPLIGAFIAIVPPVFAAFDQSVTRALIVLIALLVYQQFEDRLLVPRVYGQTLGLQPLVVLLTVLIGGELLGVTGILLSLPAAAAMKVALDYFLARRKPGSLFEAKEDEVAAPDDPDGDSSETPESSAAG